MIYFFKTVDEYYDIPYLELIPAFQGLLWNPGGLIGLYCQHSLIRTYLFKKCEINENH